MKKYIKSSLQIYTPTLEYSESYSTVVDDNGCIRYYKRPLEDEENIIIFDHFQFVVNEDHTLWMEANLYLVWKIEENHDIDYQTVANHSKSLQEYKHFCDREGIDWSIAKRITSRPNWKYRTFLDERQARGEISSETVVKLIRSVTDFYEYLMNVKGMKFDVALTKKTKRIISNGKGWIKEVYVHDINKKKGSKNEFDGRIMDEGNSVKPLNNEEQEALFQTLNDIGNPEMKLIFLFSALTGARLETVLTIRLKDFMTNLPQYYTDICISQWFVKEKKNAPNRLMDVGPGTYIDTKNNTYYKLEIPRALDIAIMTYIVSERSVRRRTKAKPQKEDLHQYVFLNRDGKPFYMASTDVNKKDFANNTPPKGGAVNTFVSDILKPKLKEKKYTFDFHFHDMRATFAMNFLESHQIYVDKEIWTTLQLSRELQKRMGHKSEKTTSAYTNYRSNWKAVNEGQELHEEKLLKWIKLDTNDEN